MVNGQKTRSLEVASRARRASSLLLSITLLLPPLSGCLGPLGPSSPCEGFTVPPAHAGAAYTYDANGDVWLPSLLRPVVDWTAAGGADEQGGLTLSNGSTIQLRIAETPTPRLGSEGEKQPAYQATYVASDPDRGAGLAFTDLWIEEGSGNLLEASHRVVKEEADGRYLHMRIFTHRSWPGLLLALDLWGHPLETGESWNRSFPEGHPLPVEHQPTINLTYEVTAVQAAGSDCMADVEAVFDHSGDLPGWRMQARFSNATSLPTAFHVRELGDDGDRLQFDMRLTDHTDGLGPPLAPLDPEPVDAGLGPIAPLETGFLPEAEGILPTPWPRAYQAIQDDEEASTWLEAHPEAQPSRFDHVLGANDSRVVDRWTVEWWDGEDGSDTTKMTITQREPVLPVAEDEDITVETEAKPGVQAPRVEQAPPLPAFAELHRQVYGKDLEVIDCRLSELRCNLGTHSARNDPRAGSVAAATVWSGLVVDLRDGRVIQEMSLAERLIPPPPG